MLLTDLNLPTEYDLTFAHPQFLNHQGVEKRMTQAGKFIKTLRQGHIQWHGSPLTTDIQEYPN